MVRPHESREHKRSVAMDKILTGKYTDLLAKYGVDAAGVVRGIERVLARKH